MKKNIYISIGIAILISVGCAPPPPIGIMQEVFKDSIDTTQYVYADTITDIYHIITNPELYLGKNVKIKGNIKFVDFDTFRVPSIRIDTTYQGGPILSGIRIQNPGEPPRDGIMVMTFSPQKVKKYNMTYQAPNGESFFTIVSHPDFSENPPIVLAKKETIIEGTILKNEVKRYFMYAIKIHKK